jgi:adenylate kinase
MQRRADDNAKTVMSRLDAYHAQTAPLIQYYQDQNTLQRVNAMGNIDAIGRDISDVVKGVTAKV